MAHPRAPEKKGTWAPAEITAMPASRSRRATAMRGMGIAPSDHGAGHRGLQYRPILQTAMPGTVVAGGDHDAGHGGRAQRPRCGRRRACVGRQGLYGRASVLRKKQRGEQRKIAVVQKEAATNCAARAKSRGSPGAKSCGVRVFGELWYPAGARSGRRGPPRAGGGGFRGVQIVRTRLPALYGARGCG